MAKTFLSLNAKAYLNTSTSATPVWNEMVDIHDLKLGLDKAEVDASTRGGGGWGADVATLKKATIDFNHIYDTSSTIWQKLQDMFINGTVYEFAIMDQAIATTGAQGLRAFCCLTKFEEDENLEGIKMNDCTLKPSRSSSAQYAAPSWYTAP